jgi:hypothetical protein
LDRGSIRRRKETHDREVDFIFLAFLELSAVDSCSPFRFLNFAFKSSGTLDEEIFREIKYKKNETYIMDVDFIRFAFLELSAVGSCSSTCFRFLT